MSSLSSAELPKIAGQITTTLLPSVRKIDTHDDSNTLSIIVAVSIVFILAPVTISSNTLILAAFYRYKRLRTASNWLLASLAVSDFGVGIFMPFGIHLELSGIPKTGVTSLCIIPYCIIIALCCVSVLVTVAIAVDRLTSLAQPLRYKNIITHSSVEKYIAVFWIYAIAVGLTPLVYAKAIGIIQPQSGSCRFGTAVQPPVRVFLVVAVWAPSALVLLGCYIYVYLVARAHARAIYTVELSFRHETQTLALPRYGQTLALTVGAFFVLWLPLQTCMLLDIFCGTKILTEWSVFWLSLPILAHSGLNPWIYAFHHGEMRVAAGKIAEDLVILFGIHPSRYGCSPMHRPSNFELADINNKSNDEDQRPPVEDCFAAKYTASTFCPIQKKLSNNDTDISPEENDSKNFTNSANVSAIIEEDAHDLVKMLGQDYVNDRNTIIDSNHNIDKIKNLKYLLDPTFNKIRYLRRLNNNKNGYSLANKNHRHESKFKSYQYLNQELINKKSINVNAMSEPMLNNTETNFDDSQDTINESLNREILRLKQRRDSGLSSLSDPNIKGINNSIIKYSQLPDFHGHSVQSLDKQPRSIQLRQNNSLKCQQIKTKNEIITKWRQASRQLTITANKLTNLFYTDSSNHNHSINHHDKSNKSSSSSSSSSPKKNINCLKYSESIVGIERTESLSSSRYLVPNGKIDLLALPRIRSEPPSPIDPLPLGSLLEEESSNDDDDDDDDEFENNYSQFSRRNSSKCSVRYSDPVPYVLLNIEDFDGDCELFDGNHGNDDAQTDNLKNEILKSADENVDKNFGGNLFVEHDSINSRRPSDLRWSESSRSQEVLSNLNNHKLSPSSYSVHNYDDCTSSGDLNDDNFRLALMDQQKLSSSIIRESIPNDNSRTRIEKDNLKTFNDNNDSFNNCENLIISTAHSSVSSINLKYCNENCKIISQSKSTESVIKDSYRHAILKTKLRGSVNDKIQVKIGGNFLLNDCNTKIKRNNIFKISELRNSATIDISTSTKIDGGGDIKCTNGSIGVRV